METKLRVGTFFLLVGTGLLLLFVGSVMGKDIKLLYLFLGFVALFLGFLLRRGRPTVESTRFESLRKMNEHSRQRRQEKEKKNRERDKKNRR